MRAKMGTPGSPVKSYDYLLKFLLVGDSDVGKGEILDSLQDGSAESPYAYSSGIDYKTTTILLDGRRVKLELWDTSGQGRFCTIFRSYSRGAQGILLVYDITNRWSFDGIDRWIREIDEHAPGVPRILVGNRLHLAFKRQVPTEQARAYAEKNGMTFFEVSPLCNFNLNKAVCLRLGAGSGAVVSLQAGAMAAPQQGIRGGSSVRTLMLQEAAQNTSLSTTLSVHFQ
ncbi:hypothetical protein JZ751_028384 [Albula glossodonta]|uniref:small monomeric GTPase n=1 Tax=Albula glossodonta TaxID=121402 RepID=A0A8T2NMK2_9TELE|nr:hypothetical protein JZ751_028384 [Albula glossodonta]